MPTAVRIGSTLIASALLTAFAVGQGKQPAPAEPLKVLGSIPIREVTIFKDGHAFVVHEGEQPVNAAGDVLIDELPQPVMGTFWPYAKGSVKLAAVTAGRRRVRIDRTALDVKGLLQANPGAEVFFVDNQGRHAGVVIGVPARSAEELAQTEPPEGGERLPQSANYVLVKTAEGIRAAPLDGIKEVTFRANDFKKQLSGEEFRNLLTLDLDWGGVAPGDKATVGLGYLQKGLRWIPSYHVAIDGSGQAKVRLEATIVNDLADLDGVSANLVIGVPTFDFKGMIDPIALQAALVAAAPQQEMDRQYLSNALMSQVVSYADSPRDARPGGEPEISGGAQNEDLYMFSVRNLSLRRGERMVVPVVEFTIPYRDVYTLDYDFGPPSEVRAQVDMQRQEELARKLSESKVMHKLRISNKSAYPLTTAPALIMRDGKLLAQSTMLYTSAGSDIDLPVTNAVDIKAKRSEKETGRTPDAEKWRGSSFYRVDLDGTIEITNFKDKAVTIEVSRQVLGGLDAATPDGAVTQLSLEEFWSTAGQPRWWWYWYGWPSWWGALNGVGKAQWTLTIEPKKKAALSYKWHYYGG